MDGSQPLDPRKTIFVGGVPRPLRAGELLVLYLLVHSFFFFYAVISFGQLGLGETLMLCWQETEEI